MNAAQRNTEQRRKPAWLNAAERTAALRSDRQRNATQRARCSSTESGETELGSAKYRTALIAAMHLFTIKTKAIYFRPTCKRRSDFANKEKVAYMKT
jgi:hypothetical protein